VPPSSFYGTVKVDGANVLTDTVVSVWIDGVQCGQKTVETISSETIYRGLDALGDDPGTPGKLCGVENDTVVFHIGSLVADQTASWHSGTNVQVNLTATGAGVPENITVQVRPAELTVNSGATALITATVVDVIGLPVVGVTLTGNTAPTALGSVSLPGATNAAGQAYGTWTAGSAAGVGLLSVGNGSITETVSITLNNPLPALTSLNPTTATVGSQAFTLTVAGTGFVAGSQVYWNGSARPTAFAGNTQLQVAISASDVTITGTLSVTVVNPMPGGGTSNALPFTVVSGPPKYMIFLPVTFKDSSE
jgi:hypothetical protein